MKILVLVILLHLVTFPMSTGNTLDLSCLVCYSSPEQQDEKCDEGLGTPKQCSTFHQHKKPGKRRKYFLCANKVIQNASVYGFYRTRACVTDKEAKSFCHNRNPEERLFKHCSTCTFDGCNNSPKLISFPILTATCAIVLFMIFSI